MLTLGAISFAAPWLLLALATLPVLWWLLRAVPPAPSRVMFPAIRLLFGLPQSEETPSDGGREQVEPSAALVQRTLAVVGAAGGDAGAPGRR